MKILSLHKITLVLLASFHSLNAQVDRNEALELDSLSQKVESLLEDVQDLRQSNADLEEIVLEQLNVQILIADNNLLRKEKSDLEKENTDLKNWKLVKQQEINMLNSAVSHCKAVNDTLNSQLEQGTTTYQTILEHTIANLLQTGTTSDKAFAKNLLKLAIEKTYVRTAELENFIIAVDSLEGLMAGFTQFKDREELANKSSDLYATMLPFPGLREEFNFIVFRVNSYCEFEQKLLKAIEVAQTQSNEDNRQKQLRRRTYEFNYYPALKAELIKLIEDRNYVFQPKCTN